MRSPKRSTTKQTAHSSRKSASLNPEFDAVQDAIREEIGWTLEDLINDPDIGLRCDECGVEYVFDEDYIEADCPSTLCEGVLEIIDDEGHVIKLPEALKKSNTTPSSTGTYRAGGTYGGMHTVDCKHEGDKVVFEFNGKKLYAANNRGINEWSGKWDLIVDLAGIVNVPSPQTFVSQSAPAKFRVLKQYINTTNSKLPSEVLRLNWQDMGVPPVGLSFWQTLWELLPEKTVIGCFGGHGRTGTCLGSLMITAGIDFYSAVETVRKDHCSKAIETLGQEKYLHQLYVDYLKELQKNGGLDEKAAIDVKEDLEYALANPPSQPGRKDYGGSGNFLPGLAPTSSGSTSATTVYYAVGSKPAEAKAGSDLAEALATGRHVKTIGDVVWIEECGHTDCTKKDCDERGHQKWVEWEFSNTYWDSPTHNVKGKLVNISVM